MTQKTNCGQDEKVIVEKDKMGLAQALIILHEFRGRHIFGQNVEAAFQAVFEFIDDMAILLQKIEGIYESKVTEAGVAAAAGADQDDRSDS